MHEGREKQCKSSNNSDIHEPEPHRCVHSARKDDAVAFSLSKDVCPLNTATIKCFRIIVNILNNRDVFHDAQV